MQIALATIRERLAAARQHLENAEDWNTPESVETIAQILKFAEQSIDDVPKQGKFIASGIVQAALKSGTIVRTIRSATSLPEAKAENLAHAVAEGLQRFIANVNLTMDAVSKRDLADADGTAGGEGEAV